LTHVGKYQLISKLATGGMAEVFLAKVAGPMGFEKTLVLKRILPHLAEDAHFVGMFFTEARVAAQLNHPHIVQIFDFGEAEGTYYLAMEYIDGPDLRTLAARATQAGVQLPPVFCAKLIALACEGLAFAHDFVDPATGESLGLIHRDISPDNILLSRQGAVKVVDFGIAKAANQSHKTQTGLIKGKIAYMPPEQLQAGPLDRRVDVYALGVVLYELLTGQYPFDATTNVSMMQAIMFEPLIPAASRRPDLPQGLLQILDKALAKVREQRYPDCVALLADLERFILSTGQPVGARDLSQWVERLCPKGVGQARPVPSREGDSVGFEQTLMSPNKTPAGETRPRSMAAPVDTGTGPTLLSAKARTGNVVVQDVGEDAEAPLEPTLLSSGKAAGLQGKAAVPTEVELAPPARRNRTGMGVALGALVLLAAGSGVLFFRSSTPPPPIVVTSKRAEPPAAVAPPPPVQRQPEPEVVAPSTGTAPEHPVEAPAPVAAEAPRVPEAGEEKPSAEPTPPEPADVPSVRRKAAQKVALGFRIRPYATVLLDGAALGQTPLKPVPVSIGTHTVRLINRDLDKDITRTIEVKAGQANVFKHDLLAD
jgi:serine/threonine-protein kinase